MAAFAHDIGEAQRGVTKAAASVDDMITWCGRNLHPVPLEIILPVEECPRDVLLPTLDPDVMPVARHFKDRERAEKSGVLSLFHAPEVRSRNLRAILRCVERKADMQMSEYPEQEQLIVKGLRRFVRQQHACLMEPLCILQQEGEVGHVLTIEKRSRCDAYVTIGVKVVLLERVHQLKHAPEQFVLPVLTSQDVVRAQIAVLLAT